MVDTVAAEQRPVSPERGQSSGRVTLSDGSRNELATGAQRTDVRLFGEYRPTERVVYPPHP
jgi:hypothetical protein